MRIEIAIENDSKSILELQKVSFHQRGLDYNNMNLIPLVETHGDFSKTFINYKYLKAIINDIIIGSVRANESNGTCYISRLIVHPNYQRKGIGSKLLLEIEKHFREKVKRFELFTGESNRKSISIYKNLGYTVNRRSDDYEVPIVYLGKNSIDLNEFVICNADVSEKRYQSAIKILVKEYFNWGNSITIEKHNYNFDIESMYAKFIEELPMYTYPDGLLKLIEYKSKYIGIGGFKKINETTCELKRMYIQQKYRGNKIGKLLLLNLIENAEGYGYEEMRLESARFMINGYALYSQNGFEEIEIYSDVESPKEYQSIIYCMKRKLWPIKK